MSERDAGSEPRRVAVLPVEDSRLFRSERADLRTKLLQRLSGVAPSYGFVALAEVDAAIRPVSKEGNLCAWLDAPVERRARNAGWLHTDLLHVLGVESSPEAYWVRLVGWGHQVEATFTAPVPRIDDVHERYAAAFAALVPNPEAGALLDGLGVAATDERAAKDLGVSVCQRPNPPVFGGCAEASKQWKPAMPALAKCFAGIDEASVRLLLDVQADATRCESTNVHATLPPRAQREACLCAGLLPSTTGVEPGRYGLDIRYLSPDLEGKPRPALRLIEASPNLHAAVDWHRPTGGNAVHRLVVGNLDALAAPLSRCTVPAARTIMATLAVAEHGGVQAVQLEGPAPKVSACIEAALKQGGFDCTSDGEPALLRLAMRWPAESTGEQ
ncbi:MAG: hypothetical protein ACOC1F_07385 [Myxococcota bacterium]